MGKIMRNFHKRETGRDSATVNLAQGDVREAISFDVVFTSISIISLESIFVQGPNIYEV